VAGTCIWEATRIVCAELDVGDADKYAAALARNLFPTLELVQAEVSTADALTMGVPLRVAKALLQLPPRAAVRRWTSCES
jgi:hypothetical protein